MKIGIVSDTHGNAEVWDKLSREYLQDVDYIIHAGDVLYHGPRNPILAGYNPAELARLLNEGNIPIFFAKGNCDADVEQLMLDYPIQNPYLFLRERGLSIMVNHGANLTFEEILTLSKKYKVRLFISGHTHVPVLEKKGDVYILNPGSPSLPKGEGIPTIAILKDDKISLININNGEILKEINLQKE